MINKKILKGTVASNKMDKTVVVKVETRKPHPVYKKIVKSWKKYKAHTEENFEIGDNVAIEEHSPVSKDKRWIVIGKIEK